MSDAILSDAEPRVWTKDSVLDLIKFSDKALSKALWNLYQRQTAAEQAAEVTVERNNRGFNSRDAEFLTSVAKALPRWNYNMTARQKTVVRRMLPKYWRQLLEMIAEKGGQVDYKAKSLKGEVAESHESETAEPLDRDIAAVSPVLAPAPSQSSLFGSF